MEPGFWLSRAEGKTARRAFVTVTWCFHLHFDLHGFSASPDKTKKYHSFSSPAKYSLNTAEMMTASLLCTTYSASESTYQQDIKLFTEILLCFLQHRWARWYSAQMHVNPTCFACETVFMKEIQEFFGAGLWQNSWMSSYTKFPHAFCSYGLRS